MKAMVLAAGLGERMRPLTDSLPKPLLPVANRPVMGYVLDHLARHGFTEVVANLHYRPEQIVDHFGEGAQYGVNLHFSYEDELLGAAGAVRHCMEFLGEETFLVTGADDLTTMDLTALLSAHREVGALASIALVDVENTSEFGIVVTDRVGRVQRFVEKPKGKAPSNTANTQIYLFEPKIFEFIPPGRPYDFGFGSFPALVDAGAPFYGFRLDGYWRDIGSISDYLEAQLDALDGKLNSLISGTEVSPGLWLGKDCRVHETAKLTPPLVVGNRCQIDREARLGGGTAIAADITVPSATQLWHTVVWEGARVPEGSSLRSAVITPEGVVHG
jgi:mannose-1-phosphate guanylyltransferase/phosphomannomutase